MLHFDSDMLVHDPMHGAWIAESIDILRNNANVAITSPQPGPPRASSLGQWLRGRPDGDSGVRWVPAGGVSTRIFLMDRERLEGALPLENGSTGEALESMLALGLSKAGLERWDRNDHNTWAIHPRRHNQNHIRHLAGLIELVERGRYPYLRTGYNWDIRTEGRHFIPWRVLLLRERLRS